MLGGFGAYRGRSTLGGTYHGVDALFSWDGLRQRRRRIVSFFPALTAPRPNYGIAQKADRDRLQKLLTATSIFATLLWRGGGRGRA